MLVALDGQALMQGVLTQLTQGDSVIGEMRKAESALNEFFFDESAFKTLFKTCVGCNGLLLLISAR